MGGRVPTAVVRSLRGAIVDHPDKLERPSTNPLWRQLDADTNAVPPIHAYSDEPLPTLGQAAQRGIEQSQNLSGVAIWLSKPPCPQQINAIASFRDIRRLTPARWRWRSSLDIDPVLSLDTPSVSTFCRSQPDGARAAGTGAAKPRARPAKSRHAKMNFAVQAAFLYCLRGARAVGSRNVGTCGGCNEQVGRAWQRPGS